MTTLEIWLLALCFVLWIAGGDLLFDARVAWGKRGEEVPPKWVVILLWPLVWLYAMFTE